MDSPVHVPVPSFVSRRPEERGIRHTETGSRLGRVAVEPSKQVVIIVVVGVHLFGVHLFGTQSGLLVPEVRRDESVFSLHQRHRYVFLLTPEA